MASSGRIVSWRPRQVTAGLVTEVAARMEVAVTFAQTEARSSMTTGNQGGANPSPPGSPPHIGTGALRASIMGKTIVNLLEVVGVLYSNVPYALRQELGFVGTDALGRRYSQAPRPFLRPAIFDNQARIFAILFGG